MASLDIAYCPSIQSAEMKSSWTFRAGKIMRFRGIVSQLASMLQIGLPMESSLTFSAAREDVIQELFRFFYQIIEFNLS
jgi:hypothetical protein